MLSEDVVNVLETMDVTILVIFWCEIGVKVVGQAPAVALLLQRVERVRLLHPRPVRPPGLGEQAAILRLLRLLRVLKLLKMIEQLQVILRGSRAASSIGYIAVLLFLVFTVWDRRHHALQGERPHALAASATLLSSAPPRWRTGRT